MGNPKHESTRSQWNDTKQLTRILWTLARSIYLIYLLTQGTIDTPFIWIIFSILAILRTFWDAARKLE